MSESDRELLELAAKAAEIEHGADRFDCGISLTLADGHHKSLPRWNPLEDDGDALRLAVKLNLFNGAEFYHFRSLERFGRQDEDDRAATRRAIVRAAAEIGRAM